VASREQAFWGPHTKRSQNDRKTNLERIRKQAKKWLLTPESTSHTAVEVASAVLDMSAVPYVLSSFEGFFVQTMTHAVSVVRRTTLHRRLWQAIGMAAPISLVLALQPAANVEAASGPCPGTYSAPVTCAVTYFPYTGGAQLWTVPDGVTAATVDAFGAQGGGSGGGLGGEAAATITVSPGQQFQINVGGAGANNGKAGFNGGGGFTPGPLPSHAVGRGGGGASDVRSGGFTLGERLVVGGGGGGQGGDGIDYVGSTPSGGAGGGGIGQIGSPQKSTSSDPNQNPGSGGSQTVGGLAGSLGTAANGAPGIGGNGGASLSEPDAPGGGGGGGGYFGGGGGTGGGSTTPTGAAGYTPGAGGGGGSGFGPGGVVFHNGVRSGNGVIVITYWAPAAPAPSATSTPAPPAAPTATPVASASPTATAPRPDLAGARVQQPGTPAIYLVDDDGTLRHIPDSATYSNLFRDGTGIQTMSVSTITAGPDLTSGAYLATPSSSAGAIYLVTNGQKRHVVSPAVMDKFWFNPGAVQTVPQATLDGLPNGPDLT
jgi:hypothetical protein